MEYDKMLFRVLIGSIFLWQVSLAQTINSTRCNDVVAENRNHVLEFNEKCYHFVQHELTWAESRDSCRSRSMVLVSIPDGATNQQLFQHGADLDGSNEGNRTNYWIGARYQNRETGLVTWEEDPGTGFTNFDTEFINRNDGQCITMELALNGRWAPLECNQPGIYTGYICATADAPPTIKAAFEKILFMCLVTSILWHIF